jgi:undecaprenyl-diphosphatase
MQLDSTLFFFFNHLPHSYALDTLALWMHYATRYGLLYYPFLLVLLVSKNRQRKLLGALLALSAASTYVLTDVVLKNLAQRPRPFQVLQEVLFLPPAPSSYSFPSGQAGVAFALATVIWLQYPRTVYSYSACTFALLMAVNRMYMGHHYFLDVLVGGLIGALVAYTTNRYFTRLPA